MAIVLRDDQTMTILLLDGHIVAEDSSSLREKIESLLKSPIAVKVIDVTEVEFIDSFALGQIVYYCNNAGGANGPVYVLNRSTGGESYIDRLIEISELHQVFTIIASTDAIGGTSAPEED
ncbi:MAG: STAS domain-containing protein [Chitinispirillaceae bacterium]|nr:STAS domain-containing protein [Chitinispirillaceae bacterium]